MESTHRILGYWNLSEGADDPGFLLAFDAWASEFARDGVVDWPAAHAALKQEIAAAAGQGAFVATEQAEGVLAATLGELPDAYRRHHQDLLAGRTDAELWPPLAMARASQAVLRQGPPWDDAERLVGGAIRELNAFLGYRPVAVLQNEQRCEPYGHERVAAIPLYLRGAGVGTNRYRPIVAAAIELLRGAPEEVTHAAGFDWSQIAELAIDPREYDFEHPVHQRPNHLFGEWDPDSIDDSGSYDRFVVRLQLLDALLARPAPGAAPDEAAFEAAAAAAGVILMASGMTRGRPDGHDSTVTLGRLTPVIAAYRDEFYESLMRRLSSERPDHFRRLEAERAKFGQPFAAVRQHLNRELAERRTRQHSAAQLAQLYDRLGRPRDAEAVAAEAPPALRMATTIRGRILAAQRAARQGDEDEAVDALRAASEAIDRGIECGALVDPWNLLGFQGQFSIFPAVENSLSDPRIARLVELVRSWFVTGVGLWAEAASHGETEVAERVGEAVAARAEWWDRFATTEAAGGAGFSAARFLRSGERTSSALTAWREHSGAAGDLAFWRPHVMDFKSGHSFVRIARVLLDRGDFVASMSLLIQWLNQGEDLDGGGPDASFHAECRRWLDRLFADENQSPDDRWRLAIKFFDYLEANAEEYWEPPGLEVWGPGGETNSFTDEEPWPEEDDEELDEEEEGDLFAAAYEDVVFRDSTDDGVEGETVDEGRSPTAIELDAESKDLRRRFAFFRGFGTLLRVAAQRVIAATESPQAACEVADRLRELRRRICEVAAQVAATLDRLAPGGAPPSLATAQAMMDFDRARRLREELQEDAAATIVELRDAEVRLAAAALHWGAPEAEEALDDPVDRLLAALWRRDVEAADGLWEQALAALAEQPLLYLPLARGGRPEDFLASKRRLLALEQLSMALAQLGMLQRCGVVLDLAMHMERSHRVASGSYTEFDRLFFATVAGVAGCVVRSARADPQASARELASALDGWNQALLARWLAHSQGLRLSAVERFSDSKSWQSLKSFIQEFGRDLFTQQFLGAGNLRFIRHVGAEAYLERLEELDGDDAPRILEATAGDDDRRRELARRLANVADAVLENYHHYREYNSTTTASDRGDQLFVLLDFLRLLAAYDRIAWNLAPVAVVHETLTEEGEHEAAEIWRQAMVARTTDAAAEHLRRYDHLCGEYGVQLQGVRQRLAERFVQPLIVHRLRPLLQTVLQDGDDAQRDAAFDDLRSEIEELSKDSPAAAGGAPPWMVHLEREAARVAELRVSGPAKPGANPVEVAPSWESVQDELNRWLDANPTWE